MDERWLVGGRLGWDKIKSVDCSNPKLIVTHWMEPYAPFLRIMSAAPLPAHELRGKDFNKFWNDRVTVSNGAFKFDHWSRSVEYVLKRDPNYWNAGKNDLPYLDTLTYRFVKDTNTMKIQLRTGEVDWINPPPDTSLIDELKTFPRSSFQSIPGGYWEHIAFQTKRPPLDNVNVRRGIAFAIDRKQLTDVVLRGQTEPLDSPLLPAAKDYYEPVFKDFVYDEKQVAENLTKAGYKRDGQWWTKDGKPLTIVFKSTAGNALRMKVAQVLQQAFKHNGIKMEIALELPAVFFGQSTIGGKYDLAEWAWSSDVDPTQTGLFACDQIPSSKNKFEGSNYYQWCNAKATAALHEADRSPDTATRAAQLKIAQEVLAQEVPLLPLYQRPDTVAYSNRLHGIRNNPLGGQLWNPYDWWVSE
jgi:peptide/nickel transport system substrate-binding protein